MADPNGGTFDAAGDLDRLLLAETADLRVLDAVDPNGDTVLTTAQMVALLHGIDDLTSMEAERVNPIERRGLTRLRAMAERCRDEPGLSLWFVGD